MTAAPQSSRALSSAPRSPLRAEIAAYSALFVRSVRANFAYRQSLLPSMLAAALSYAVPVLVWRHVYATSAQSHAVPSETMFPYLLLAGCLNYSLAIGVETRVGLRIRTGMIATDLLKPVDFQLAQASQAMSDGLFNSFLCLPIAAVAYAFLGAGVLPANGWAFAAFAISLVLAFSIMFSISFLFVQAAFFTYSGYGIFAARSALQQTFSGLSAPLLMFPAWLRTTSEWLPFRHTIHSPLALYLGWTSGRGAALLLVQQALWAILLFFSVAGRSRAPYDGSRFREVEVKAYTPYLAAFRAALQAKLEYRADFVVGMLTSMALQFAALSFLLVVFQNTPSLAGWRGPEVLFLFGMTAVCLGGSELFFNHIWMLPQYIVSGDLDRLLMYPLNSLAFFLVTRPELHALGNLLTGGALLVGSMLALHAPLAVWLLVPVWCVCGSLIYTSLLVVFGSLSFKLLGPYSFYLMVPHNLLQATRYPLSIYPSWLFSMLLIVVPFGCMHFVPASFLFGKALGVWRLGVPPLAAALCLLEAHWVWNWGLRQYESTGS